MAPTRGKTTPDSTAGSFTASSGQRSRVQMAGSNIRQDALAERIAQLNSVRLVLSIDSALPTGIARCVECGQFVSEMEPEHDCPLPKMTGAGMSAGRARDLARSGFDSPDEVDMWASAIDDLGMTEAGAFKMLGYTPVDAKRAAKAGQSAYEMLSELAEADRAAEASASEPKPARKKKAAAEVVWPLPAPDINLAAARDSILAAGSPAVGDGVTLDGQTLRKAMGVLNAQKTAPVILASDGNGNLIVADEFGLSAQVIPGAAQGGPWIMQTSPSHLREGMAGGKKFDLAVTGDGQMKVNGNAYEFCGPTRALSDKLHFDADIKPLDSALAGMIADVAKSTSNDAARPILTTVALHDAIGGGNIAVATDSYRLRIRATPDAIPADGDWSSKIDREVNPMMINREIASRGVTGVGYAANENGTRNLVASCGDGGVASDVSIDGYYPNWGSLATQQNNHQMRIPKIPDMRRKLKAATGGESPVKVATDSQGRTRIWAVVQNRGTTVVHEDAGFDIADVDGRRCAYNAGYLSDILEGHPDDEVVFNLPDSIKPSVIPHPQGCDVLMPVRTEFPEIDG